MHVFMFLACLDTAQPMAGTKSFTRSPGGPLCFRLQNILDFRKVTQYIKLPRGATRKFPLPCSDLFAYDMNINTN